MRSAEEIVALYRERRADQDPQLSRMRDIRDAYNGDIILPVPELNDAEKSTVANLLALGIDQNARRIASTSPNIEVPAEKEGIQKSEKAAEDRRRAWFGMWDHNRMHMKLYRRARWFVAYTASPVLVRPDMKTGRVLWQLRDPLTAYPAKGLDLDELAPPDCIFAYRRSPSWLGRNYPNYRGDEQTKPGDSVSYEIVEYVDDQQISLVLVATTKHPATSWEAETLSTTARMLDTVENRAGVPLVVSPGRITLDRPQGQFDGVIGIYQAQARLNALEMIAMERAIFPEQWFIQDPTSPQAGIITLADAKRGIVGEAKGGKFENIRPDPGVLATQQVDRLERNIRVEAGVPAEFGGEGATNVRTGRRGDQILSATIDFPIQEAQLIFAESLEHENRLAVKIEKAYFGNEPKSFYVNWPGAKGKIDYTPNDLWTSDEHSVNYSHAGADVNGLVISGGERVGMGTLSKRGFMEIDPLIDDPEREHERIIAEQLEAAVLQSVAQGASSGSIPPHFVARIASLVLAGKVNVYEAVDQVQKEAQAAQAQQVPPGAPEAQSGIAQPGAGAEATIAPPGASQTNLADLLNSLRRPQRSLPGEQNAAVVPGAPALAGTPGGEA